MQKRRWENENKDLSSAFKKNNITNEKAHYFCSRFDSTARSISVKFTYNKKKELIFKLSPFSFLRSHYSLRALIRAGHHLYGYALSDTRIWKPVGQVELKLDEYIIRKGYQFRIYNKSGYYNAHVSFSFFPSEKI